MPQDPRQPVDPARRVVLQGDVEVRERHGEPDDLAVALREAYQVGDDDRLELFREVIDLGLGERHEPPVLLPRPVVERLDQLHLFPAALPVERPQGRSEERRVGKEGRSWWATVQYKEKVEIGELISG